MIKSVSVLGCGWLGMPLGKRLAQGGYNVFGSYRNHSLQLEIERLGMVACKVDLNSSDHIDPIFFESDVIILSFPPSNASSEQQYHDQLDKVLEMAAMRTRILFISSTGVYPSWNKVVTESDADASATSRSGFSLLRAEEKFHSGQHTVVRFGGLIDERRNPGKWFAGRTNLSGGSEPVNLIHLEDCIGAITTIIERELWGEIFNVCAPDHPIKKEYYPIMTEKLGLQPPHFNDEENTPWKVVSSEYFVRKSEYSFTKTIWEL